MPKLRMAGPEPPEQLARRIERERRTEYNERELELDRSLEGFRVGSVKALNTVPLTRGIEDQVIHTTPAKLAELLRADELDAALVSIVEPLLNDRYDILDGIGVASLGEVKSVLLAHREPLEEMREVYCDTASLTSVRLLRVLLAERGLNPEFKPLTVYDFANAPDNLLLIGDAALNFLFSPHTHEILDLGAAWYEMTGLPFVYAAWSLRRGVPNAVLKRRLQEAKDFGLDTLDYIIRTRTEYTLDFRKDYFGWHLHYHLGTDEKRGIAKFMELMQKHGMGPVYEPKFVV
ncbi:MAG TPA: menaquinone biosynthesis protein [Verrucomicrobia bacterium]|nr:menaquinone biosynthesis protein [Verrucomicrobiota bacterium]HOB31421.1 menaquinone biosynthesis protein [Verrucomicrobiota bacterium]HOP97427.1 menaquinone biosynthesis protein [Verrucomicrobiota bacterium]HPU54686.1 menaquinone biosynthesis protein [Verrucomicrobiota bacterium]